MGLANQVMVEILAVAERQLQEEGLVARQATITTSGTQSVSFTVPTTSTTPTPTGNTNNGTTGGGGSSSPLLFFVALGFGVVFTNLWIIVGVKYCFRYNARNRALRNGEEVDPITLENMPARPHRRRREKKLMTMDEVNERFPLTKYKAWVASRAREGLPTAGGVNAPSSRPSSVINVDGVVPSSPVETKHSSNTRPNTAGSDAAAAGTTASQIDGPGGDSHGDAGTVEATGAEKTGPSVTVEEDNHLAEVRTTASTVDKHPTTTSEEEEEEDDHIHTAVPPELLTNPGDSCAICIDLLEQDDDIRGLTCGHAFHAGCLDPWLTSRRACCPLCKADYYVPKPRPEGEALDADRSGRRRDGAARTNTPQSPHSTWTGIRGSPRLILPGRFMSAPPVPSSDARGGQTGARRGSSRTSRGTPAAGPAHDSGAAAAAAAAGTVDNNDPAARRRWRPRIANPLPSNWVPPFFPGRTRQVETAVVGNPTTETSPSQLEAGVR